MIEIHNTCDRYVMVGNAIPYDLCKSLVSDIQNSEWRKHSWGIEGMVNDDKELDVLDSSQEQHNSLKPHIDDFLTEYQNFLGEDFLHYFSSIRFNRYTAGTIMRNHYDHIPNRDGSDGIPILSIVGNLNEGYSGSEFVLRNNTINLNTGDIVIFPSSFIYPHSVTAVSYTHLTLPTTPYV